MRIALISYHYPPVRAVGGLRAAKDAGALRRAGHDVHVIAAQVPEASSPRVVERVPCWLGPRQLWLRWRTRGRAAAGQPLSWTSSASPRRQVRRWKRWVTSMLWLPDDLQGFIVSAAWAARRSFRRAGPDLVITSAPPFSAHLAGLWLALDGVRWIAEFRDPWTDNPWKTEAYRSRVSDSIERWLERKTLRRAERLVAVSEGIDRGLRTKLADAREGDRVLLVRNGIERLATPTLTATPATPRRLVHLGSCYGARDPRPFFQGLAGVIGQRRLTADGLHVAMIGKCREYRGKSIEGYVTALGIAAFVHFQDWVPHAAAQALAEGADALLLAQQQPGQVPDKLYDHLGTRRPILAFVDEAGESARMLRAVGGHVLVTQEDPGEIAAAIETVLGYRPRPSSTDPSLLHHWRTEAQMQRLVEALQR